MVPPRNRRRRGRRTASHNAGTSRQQPGLSSFTGNSPATAQNASPALNPQANNVFDPQAQGLGGQPFLNTTARGQERDQERGHRANAGRAQNHNNRQQGTGGQPSRPLGNVQQPGHATSSKRASEDPRSPAMSPGECEKRTRTLEARAAGVAHHGEKDIIIRLQSHCDKAEFYRRGKKNEWDVDVRQPIFSTKPRGGPLPERHLTRQTMQTRRDEIMSEEEAKNNAYRALVGPGHHLALRHASRLPAFQAPHAEPARVAINRGAKDLAAAGAKFVRFLGQGGFGIAALFELTNKETGATDRIVVKLNFKKEGTSDDHEKIFLKILKRSRHIVQLTSLKEVHELLGNKSLDSATLKAIKDRDEDSDLVVLRFCNRDNLRHFICLTAFHGTKMSSRLIWNFVECLGRGCMAMRAPVRFASHQTDTLPEDGPLITESTDYPKRGLNLVHFDLDPQNILMSEQPESHPEMPQLLVADFGLAQSMTDQKLNCYTSRRLMMLAAAGKHGHWAPEQFTDQWDEVMQFPFEQFYKKNGSGQEHLQPQPGCVAGAFGYWTNVWHAGMILWCCITQTKPLLPLVPYVSGDGLPPPSVWWHYAYPLLHPTDDEFNEVDPDLKRLVCRMLAHEPCNRPTPIEIVETAMKKLEDPNNGEDKALRAEFDAWYRDLQKDPVDPTYDDPKNPFPDPINQPCAVPAPGAPF